MQAMGIDSSDWEIYTVTENGRSYFQARFMNRGLPYIRRKSDTLPLWLRQSNPSCVRPNRISDAAACIPPSFSALLKGSFEISRDAFGGLVFETLELAIRMEAAFWLERQFATDTCHWFQQGDVDEMILRLISEYGRQENGWIEDRDLRRHLLTSSVK
jgi:hypothetical protein